MSRIVTTLTEDVMDNMKLWESVKRPPKEYLKNIAAGRLKGKTDISPQWRYKAATETWGPCGTGWWYEIDDLWSHPAADGVVLAFAKVRLFYKTEDGVSHPVVGVGGATEVAKEKDGLYSSDECFKMAVTDALSVCFKMLGFGADIYMGMFNDGKYRDEAAKQVQPVQLPEMSEDLKNKLRTAGCTKVSEVQRILSAFDGDVVAMEKAGEFFNWDTNEMVKAQTEVSA